MCSKLWSSCPPPPLLWENSSFKKGGGWLKLWENKEPHHHGVWILAQIWDIIRHNSVCMWGGTFFLSRVLAAGQKRFDLWRIENTGSDYLGKKGMFEIKERTGAQKGRWGASSYECVWKWRATHREEIPGRLQRAILLGREERWLDLVLLSPPCFFSFSFWKVRAAEESIHI